LANAREIERIRERGRAGQAQARVGGRPAAAAVLHPAARVALLGLLVVSLALVGGMVILWGGQQGSDVQLR
jgi:hypothetical protein